MRSQRAVVLSQSLVKGSTFSEGGELLRPRCHLRGMIYYVQNRPSPSYGWDHGGSIPQRSGPHLGDSQGTLDLLGPELMRSALVSTICSEVDSHPL